MNAHTLSRALLSVVLLATLTAAAQQPTPAAPPAPDALGPAFEVATVKPSSRFRPGAGAFFGTRLLPSGRLSARSVSVSSLVSYAYVEGPGKALVEGGPAWSDSDQYDIEAKVDDSQMAGWDQLSDDARRARVQPMVRTLLAERFHLKLHAEIRETPVYALVQAKGGAKLKQVAKPEELEGDGDVLAKMMRFMTDHPGQAAPGAFRCTGSGCSGHAVEMHNAAGSIGGNAGADRLVIDETGLAGLYDISFTISHEPDALTPMQQIEDQLGLRFESRKIPIKTYVIDSADKPTPDQ